MESSKIIQYGYCSPITTHYVVPLTLLVRIIGPMNWFEPVARCLVVMLMDPSTHATYNPASHEIVVYLTYDLNALKMGSLACRSRYIAAVAPFLHRTPMSLTI